jgi:cytoskeletal protein RodZ
MERFCDDLRREREHRNVSLETISGITKVSSRHLHALETGHFDDLPGGVFRKGILRGYLDVLGIEPAPWVERFNTLLAESAPAAPAPIGTLDQFVENVRRGRPETARAGGPGWIGVLLMILLLAAVCSFIWIFALSGHVTL